MYKQERYKFADLSAKLCSNYAKYIEALSNDGDKDRLAKDAFATLKAINKAEDELELFVDRILEDRLIVVLAALRQRSYEAVSKDVAEQIDEIILRREEIHSRWAEEVEL